MPWVRDAADDRRVTDEAVRDAIAVLLLARQPPATTCPSEVARALSPQDWRPLMPRVREAALALSREGIVDIRQGGRNVPPGQVLRGPIRLGLPPGLSAPEHPITPDGRYFVVRGRLWRKARPDLPESKRSMLVGRLMAARRALRGSHPEGDRTAARAEVDRVKRALGERGPVWWDDGTPDFNRKLVKNTPYAPWFARLVQGRPA